MVQKIVKKICLGCKKIKPHVHFEARVYWLEDGKGEKEFTLYEPINKKYKNKKYMKDQIKKDEAVSTEKKLTFGEKAVGLTFNPSGDVNVQRIKELYADIIEQLNNLRETAKTENNGEAVRLFSVAITEAQAAQMWAVKGITWK